MKIVVLTGAGMSVESGLSTFRGAGGMWDNYPVERVATHEGWEADPNYVNDFYNMLRVKYKDVKPCEGHCLLAELEKKHDVTVITQNVDALHEAGGSTNVIHLHGEMWIIRDTISSCPMRALERQAWRCHTTSKQRTVRC